MTVHLFYISFFLPLSRHLTGMIQSLNDSFVFSLLNNGNIINRAVLQKCLGATRNYSICLWQLEKLTFSLISLSTGHPGFHGTPLNFSWTTASQSIECFNVPTVDSVIRYTVQQMKIVLLNCIACYQISCWSVPLFKIIVPQ